MDKLPDNQRSKKRIGTKIDITLFVIPNNLYHVIF